MATDLSTANVVDTKSGTGWTITVTACNLLSDLSIKDFIMLIDSVLEPNSNITKTSQTVLTYTGPSISSSTVEVRRVTPQDRFQEITFAEKFSSTIFNEEVDRIIRKAFEYTLNGIGPGSTVTTVAPTNDAYPTGWSTDTVRSRTANRLFEEFEKRGTLSENEAVTGDWTATTQTDADNSTKLATTAYTDTRVTNALAGSPSLGGNPTAPTATQGDADTSIATTEFVTEAFNPVVLAETATQVTTSVQNYTIIYKTETTDLNSDYNNTTGVFTVPTNGAGIYLIGGGVHVENNDASTRPFAFVAVKNKAGTAVRRRIDQDSLILASTIETLQGSCLLQLADTDTLELEVLNFISVSMNVGSVTDEPSVDYIYIQRLGQALAI